MRYPGAVDDTLEQRYAGLFAPPLKDAACISWLKPVLAMAGSLGSWTEWRPTVLDWVERYTGTHMPQGWLDARRPSAAFGKRR